MSCSQWRWKRHCHLDVCIPVKFLKTAVNSHIKMIATFFSSVCFWPLGYLLFSIGIFGFCIFLLTRSTSVCSHCNFFDLFCISLFSKDAGKSVFYKLLKTLCRQSEGKGWWYLIGDQKFPASVRPSNSPMRASYFRSVLWAQLTGFSKPKVPWVTWSTEWTFACYSVGFIPSSCPYP